MFSNRCRGFIREIAGPLLGALGALSWQNIDEPMIVVENTGLNFTGYHRLVTGVVGSTDIYHCKPNSGERAMTES